MKSINKNLITAMPLPAFLLVFLFLSVSSSLAQPRPITKGENRLVAFEKYMEMKARSPFTELAWQFVGPGNISIRCTDVEVVRPKGQSYTMYAATASGGLWKTVNEGTTWEPLTEDLATASIGDIALDPSNPDILWMGTGEANIFRSSQSGAGIFRTTDGGKTWKHLGLENTFTIARILVNPRNSQVVYVAASGHEWTPNPERGVYKTTNGGETWEKILYVNELTGAIDLVMHPENPDILYAATWQRIRKKWNDPRNEPGYNGSGIWKTTDGGKTWKKVNNGLPEARYRGRIGIDIARSNPEVLYAFIDNYEIIREAYGETDSYGRPRGGVIMGATVYRTSNGALSWQRVSGQTEEMARYMERHSGTYGWVFGQIRVDPNDENTIYTMGVQLHVSNDGGKTFRTLRGMHADHHGLWIDPDNSDYLFNANDGGVCVSYDRGETWHLFTERLQASQFFNVQVDNADPFHIYGSIQDHGSYRAEVDLIRGRDRIPVADFEWAPGGEGSNHAIDPTDPNRVYAAGFYGNMIRGYLQENGWQTKTIVPRVYEDEPPLRGQWMAPFILSPHNPDIVYLGMQYLFRSIDRGNTWERISPDLTYNDPKKMGDIPYQTLFTISESPLMPGLIYAGTDDGRAHLTKDGGKTWTEITKGLVPDRWVSRVVASRYHMGTVYLTQNGKRDDDFAPYIWKSDDYGKTWKSIVANIPIGPVNVIREDPFNRDILYVGTDAGVFVTKDGGNHWDVLGDLPMTYVLDLVIQERENFIVIGTHGRGVWLMDANEINGGTRPRWRR
ncbi:MAG TPA: hypothetical protein ENN63_01565 [Bacteroidetes bacterium]|nr:hypothetical protein [Bacteroidota bacterium]